MRRASPNRRTAFTLIELLIVITIIGILIGLIVPAVMYARRTIMQKAMVMEVQTLANAVDQYKNKFGDYPPDGTDATIFTRHCRKLFPNMAPSELTAVSSHSNSITRPSPAGVMDPAEALVFFLGGFSKDPVHPFTGTGGPLVASPAGSSVPYQYNVDRNEPLYEFNQAQLTLTIFDDGSNQLTVSNDESTFGFPTPPITGIPGDLIPVYHPKGKLAPFVYFDSRTYSLGGTFFNQYDLGGYGVARPYKASKGDGYDVNTKVSVVASAGTAAQRANNDVYYRYVNDRTYQIISAGLDDSYGGIPNTSSGPSLFFCYPNGISLDITIGPGQTRTNRYSESTSGIPSPQLDNATNFAEGILSDELSN